MHHPFFKKVHNYCTFIHIACQTLTKLLLENAHIDVMSINTFHINMKKANIFFLFRIMCFRHVEECTEIRT